MGTSDIRIVLTISRDAVNPYKLFTIPNIDENIIIIIDLSNESSDNKLDLYSPL